MITFVNLHWKQGKYPKAGDQETGAVAIHPYNDYRIIAGQGTAAIELLQEVPDLDIILAPVGGGGC